MPMLYSWLGKKVWFSSVLLLVYFCMSLLLIVIVFYVNDSLSNKDMMCLEQIDLFTAILIWQFKPKVNDILSITVTVFPYIHSFHYITSSISIQKLLLHVVCMQCKNTKPISKHLNFFFRKTAKIQISS